MDDRMPIRFPWSEPWSREAFQRALTQFDQPPTGEGGSTSQVSDLAFVVALIGHTTNWA
jgi:hypothetical protein